MLLVLLVLLVLPVLPVRRHWLALWPKLRHWQRSQARQVRQACCRARPRARV